MPHHFTKGTVSVTVFCRTCNEPTMHYVFDGRLGRCMKDHHPPKPEKKVEPPQPSLFDEPKGE